LSKDQSNFINWAKKAGLDPIDSLIFYFYLGTSVGGEIGFFYSFRSEVSKDFTVLVFEGAPKSNSF
jgi:hypothetical protein